MAAGHGGERAVDRSAEAPLGTALALGVVAAGKLLAAGIPVAVVYGKLQQQPLWRATSWIGGAFLVLYGGVNAVHSGAVRAGTFRPDGDGGYDAWLWDPLFFIWGLALCLALWLSR